jgi:hypothetical protein
VTQYRWRPALHFARDAPTTSSHARLPAAKGEGGRIFPSASTAFHHTAATWALKFRVRHGNVARLAKTPSTRCCNRCERRRVGFQRFRGYIGLRQLLAMRTSAISIASWSRASATTLERQQLVPPGPPQTRVTGDLCTELERLGWRAAALRCATPARNSTSARHLLD